MVMSRIFVIGLDGDLDVSPTQSGPGSSRWSRMSCRSSPLGLSRTTPSHVIANEAEDDLPVGLEADALDPLYNAEGQVEDSLIGERRVDQASSGCNARPGR